MINAQKVLNGVAWSEEEVCYLKEHYQSSASIQEIASSLDRSPSSVRIKAQRLGLQKTQSRHWTKKELQYLEDNWGSINHQKIASALDRTSEAVKYKALKLGYPCFQLTQDGITLSELAAALGVDYKKVRRWVVNFNLPIFHVKITEKQQKRLVNLDKFWKWAAANKELIDFNRVEKNILGAEPKWMAEQRKRDYYDVRKEIRYSNWTKEEERRLERLVNEFRYTYSEIAERLNRPEKVISKKLVDLNIKARPIKADPRKWSHQELDMLSEMVRQGASKTEMAKRLKRSETAITGKIRKMRKR